ncbi:hypothetical protein BpHYR1_031764 [Brachionus plicatilis]|uniref:Uncharacterized protein n=1 Tax=Brachionus plicatilis TaxID=10195 RepID=A0A3M7QPK4_BRAPC|nr:hypothetical protein BpHYR1_031764 [Brachionus plicatilis]
MILIKLLNVSCKKEETSKFFTIQTFEHHLGLLANCPSLAIFDRLHHKAAVEPQPKFNGAAAVFQFPQVSGASVKGRQVEQLLMEEYSNCCKRVKQYSKARYSNGSRLLQIKKNILLGENTITNKL